jgi:hypothetical protein
MSGEKLSQYELGHLIVAAVRLFTHTKGEMPTAEDISDLTGFPLEVTFHLCNQLLRMGVLKLVKGAFKDRYCVSEHLKIEELPKIVDKEEMVREIEKFRAKKVDRQKKIEEMFDKKEFEQERKEQLRKIEEKFKNHTKGKKPNPFGPNSDPGGKNTGD